MTVWVDDLLMGCSNDAIKAWIQKKLSDKFDMKHFDDVDAFIGIGVQKTEKGFKLHMKRHTVKPR